MRPIAFAHISDTHVDPDPAATLRCGQPLANLDRALREISALPAPVDFVLHTGDICGGVSAAVGTEKGYQHVRNLTTALNVPCYFTLGNHDHPQIAHTQLSFPPQKRLVDNDPWSYVFVQNGLTGIVLNGRIDERGRGELPESHLAALEQQLRTSTGPVVIALHFTPLLAEQHWNDNYMFLSNGEDLHNLLKARAPRIHGVFFGHLHRPFQRLRDGILYVCGPSTAYGIDFWSGESRARILDQQSIGWNWVRISDQGTEIRFVGW